MKKTTSIMKNITQEVYQECLNLNIEIDEALVSYAINIYALNPEYNSLLQSRVDRVGLEKFVDMCVEKFEDSQSPSLITLGMQSKMLSNPVDKKIIIDEQRNKMEQQLEKITRDILNDMNLLTKDDQEKLIKKLAIDTIVYNGLGNPSNGKIVSETCHALNSIMLKRDLKSFASLNKQQKMVSLQDIREIICGIRVFNKDAGHPAEGVIDCMRIFYLHYIHVKFIKD